MAVGGEADASRCESVADFFLAFGAVYAVGAAIVVGIDLANGDYWYIFRSCPGHHSADMREDSFVVSDADLAVSKEEVLLSVHIHKDLASFTYD